MNVSGARAKAGNLQPVKPEVWNGSLTVKKYRELVFVHMKHCVRLEDQGQYTLETHVLCVSFGATQ